MLQRGIWVQCYSGVFAVYSVYSVECIAKLYTLVITDFFLQDISHVRVLHGSLQQSKPTIESVPFRDIAHELLDLHDYPIHWPLELAVSPVGTVVLESVSSVYLPRCSA